MTIAQKLPYQRIDSLDKRPVLTVNGKVADPLSIYTLDKMDFRDIKWLNPAKAMEKFGKEDGKYGAVEIQMNAQADVLSWNQLLKNFYFTKAPDGAVGRVALGIGASLNVNAPNLLMSSASMIWSVGINSPYVGEAGPRVNINSPYYGFPAKEVGKFDDDIKFILLIYEEEMEKRNKVAASKEVVRG
ncbi:hypothetical protein GCM10028827_32700 [Mucilaginibacter myungsuensis]